MVVGQPYIHFKINNEPIEQTINYNYTWATTVETDKGPVNQPVVINTASQAQAIFGVDMRPYFAQGADALIMVRVASKEGNKQPSKGVYSFNTKEDIIIYRAEQVTIDLTDNNDTKRTFKLYYTFDSANQKYIPLIEHREYKDGKLVLIPESYVDSWNSDGSYVADDSGSLPKSNIYKSHQVKPFLTPTEIPIPAGTSLFNVTSKYEGDYGITISTSKVMVKNGNEEIPDGYTIVLSDPTLGTIRINNGYDVSRIVNRINDKGFNFVATMTNAGIGITEAMHSDAKSVKTVKVDGYSTTPLIIPYTLDNDETEYSIPEGTFIKIAKKNGQITYADMDDTTLTELNYEINLVEEGNQTLIGGSNGEWDIATGRIPSDYQYSAHKSGLDLLRRLRIAGIFCMYGENNIQMAYVDHGIDPNEPEKGMNNNETCRWRTIILGADSRDRDSKASLAAKAAGLNNQYILLLGQGLIDTGVNGFMSTKNLTQRRTYQSCSSPDAHQLLPYECTQYIAGLRAKLNYDESIFGGQGRKRIRGIGDLSIAPLFDYEDAYEWDPKTYTYLNESGVLTFTEDYGHISLTDGVTTVQTGAEEDEEGVMNILKYTQNGIYDICLPYIGRNINADLEQSITMEIHSFLEDMKNSDQSIIDTDEYSAYELDVSLGSRNNQLLGKIFIYLKITPVHALRQIEVEMTVQ